MVEYKDVQYLYKGNVAVYCRVSTAGQNISQQINLAEIYLSQNNINSNDVKYYLDDNVSANKLSVDKRPELSNLLNEIRAGRIKNVIVQSRDRLARNFYEYIELIKEFYKYSVKVKFTDSGQVAFSNDFVTEGILGILAQSEGRNIANKTNSAVRRFPNSIFGFNIIGKRSEKKYIPNPELVHKIRTLFSNVANLTSADQLMELILNHKNDFKDYTKFFASLTNPFYAGYISLQGTYVRLEHVEPLISLDVFKKAQESLAILKEQIQALINKIVDKGIVHPICSHCKTPMTIRNNEQLDGYFVCSKKGHTRFSIEIQQFNTLISEQVEELLENLDSKKFKKDVFAQLLVREKELQHQYNYVDKQLKANNANLISLIGTSSDNSKFDELIAQANVFEDRLRQLHSMLNRIGQVRIDINNFVNKLRTQLVKELLKYEKPFLIKQLISKVELNSEAIIYHTHFGQYILGDEEIYDYQA